MKSYPEIPRCTGQSFMEIPGAYIFDKIDGSNLRWEYSKKQGFYKFGTRKCLFDKTDKIFGESIDVFFNTLSEPLTEIFRKNKWDKVVVFTEFWGKESIAGRHVPGDPKFLTLFDVSLHKHGMLSPKEFLKNFKYLPIPNFLGIHNWSRGLIERVFNDELDGVTFEGVVAKAGEGHDLVMAKGKTKKWLDAIKARYAQEEANLIINS